MDLEGKRPQMVRQLMLPLGKRGEAPRTGRSEEEPPAVRGNERSGASDLMARVVSRPNLQAALKRVRKNKGSPGVDGMTVEELADYLRINWPQLREQLLAGRYRPAMVKQQLIPKRSGGMRKLGIPTVLDRFIQQALLQVLQPMFDPTFSQHSHGFRPGRRAHDAVIEAQRYIQQGRRFVVDVDLEQFFDRVNHDVLMGRLAKRIGDVRVLGLIRGYLEAGILANGCATERYEGTPQGGPLSPLLANVLLDAASARSPGDSANPVLQRAKGLGADPAFDQPPRGHPERVAQKLASCGQVHRAFRCVDAQPKLGIEPREQPHHPLARTT